MKSAWLLFLLAVGPLATTLHAESDTAPQRLSLLVPAYSYPGGQGIGFWHQLIASADQVPIVAIANPASGPGKTADANYVRIISKAQAAGIRVIGYVPTGYAKRDANSVQRDIDLWRAFYPSVEGIFFDEQSSGVEHVSYYKRLSGYARANFASSLIVSNPGTICAPEYARQNLFDVICVFENRQGYERFAVPDSLRPENKTQFAALPHTQADATTAIRYLTDSPGKGITYAYVTHDSLPNPWDELANYWAAEVAVVQNRNKSSAAAAPRNE